METELPIKALMVRHAKGEMPPDMRVMPVEPMGKSMAAAEGVKEFTTGEGWRRSQHDDQERDEPQPAISRHDPSPLPIFVSSSRCDACVDPGSLRQSEPVATFHRIRQPGGRRRLACLGYSGCPYLIAKTTLPIVVLPSMARCAAAACTSGNSVTITCRRPALICPIKRGRSLQGAIVPRRQSWDSDRFHFTSLRCGCACCHETRHILSVPRGS
jgi:hypothetical protein